MPDRSRTALRRRSVWYKRSPASVGATLRVVRLRSFRSSLRSKVRMVWLSADCVTPSCAAARVKLPARTTAAKLAKSSKRAIDKPTY